jgi:hypothetical protein
MLAACWWLRASTATATARGTRSSRPTHRQPTLLQVRPAGCVTDDGSLTGDPLDLVLAAYNAGPGAVTGPPASLPTPRPRRTCDAPEAYRHLRSARPSAPGASPPGSWIRPVAAGGGRRMAASAGLGAERRRPRDLSRRDRAVLRSRRWLGCGSRPEDRLCLHATAPSCVSRQGTLMPLTALHRQPNL